MVCCCCPVTTIVVGAILFFIYKKFFTPPTIKPKPAIHKTDYKKDTVYLYQFKRLKNCPNMSPFCMKLEILCRVYNIPHESLPDEQEAQSIALSRMADNHLFYIIMRYKTSVDAFSETIVGFPSLPQVLANILVPIIRVVFGAKYYSRSVAAIGDFEPHELNELLHRDLKAIQDSIKGTFIYGDKITPADATVFSQLAAVYYPFRSHISDVLEKDFPKVLEYCERVRKEVYPNDFTI
ncbi:unnamed protein product [Caenorhabditis brenneri]